MPLREDDATEMASVLADAALYAFTGGMPPGVDELRRRYSLQVVGVSPDGSEAWLNWIVRMHDGDVAVGFVQATVTGGGRIADVAWVIGTAWQDRGIAGEAARAMTAWLVEHGVENLTAHIHPQHAASASVARGLGMATTGVMDDGEVVWRLVGRSD